MQEQNIAQMLENPFMQYNHIEIVSVTSDSAVMSLDIRRDTTNIYGYVHGGAFFTMADCCAGLTARSDGRQYVTQNASVNFIHNVKAGHLTARGRTVSRRRHICVVAVEITDETDTLLFSSYLFHVLYQRRGLTALSSPHCSRLRAGAGLFYCAASSVSGPQLSLGTYSIGSSRLSAVAIRPSSCPSTSWMHSRAISSMGR